jgi:hypothetical protein
LIAPALLQDGLRACGIGSALSAAGPDQGTTEGNPDEHA